NRAGKNRLPAIAAYALRPFAGQSTFLQVFDDALQVFQRELPTMCFDVRLVATQSVDLRQGLNRSRGADKLSKATALGNLCSGRSEDTRDLMMKLLNGLGSRQPLSEKLLGKAGSTQLIGLGKE